MWQYSGGGGVMTLIPASDADDCCYNLLLRQRTRAMKQLLHLGVVASFELASSR
jgi:hypothetical protein